MYQRLTMGPVPPIGLCLWTIRMMKIQNQPYVEVDSCLTAIKLIKTIRSSNITTNRLAGSSILHSIMEFENAVEVQ